MRKSGILMHITSLPGPYGVGTMGAQARAFIDFLSEAGQSCWQILPLSPTGYGNSPYQSCAAFAGNPYLIDLDTLVEQGLLFHEELEEICWGQDPGRVDFGALYQNRLRVLERAFDRFSQAGELDAFCSENSSWLADHALFQTLKEQFSGKPWYQWPMELKLREPNAIWQARQEHKKRIRFHSFVQYLFAKQWQALRSYAGKKGISILGDIPIYVPLDSVDAWSEPELFELDETRTPTAVAGCPPDAFSPDGQLWGNPLYRWGYHAADGYSWWVRRLRSAAKLYDMVRLDHFRGFESYWSVPYGDTTARNGHWCKGPGLDLICAIQKALPDLQLIAEDLGFLTPEVLEMRDASGCPGMKLLEFGFDPDVPSAYIPYNHIPNSVCYIGTHDNMPAKQWLETLDARTLAYATEYMKLSAEEGAVWGMIRTAMSSVSDLCILQLQDYLQLGGEGRMNTPGTMTDANWTWRAQEGCCSHALAQKIREITKRYGRLAKAGAAASGMENGS